MGIIENIKTHMEQSSERKLINKKIGINACYAELGVYDKNFFEETELTPESYTKIMDMYVDEIVNKIENNSSKKRNFFEKVGKFSTDLTQGLSREELKEKIIEETKHMFQDKKVDWNLKQEMFRTIFNEIKLWITTYGIDRLLEDKENVKLEIELGIDQMRYDALKNRGKIDEEEIRKEIALAKLFSPNLYENYKNIGLLKDRYLSLLSTEIGMQKKEEINEKIIEIENLNDKEISQIEETVEQLYFDYEIINRDILLESMFATSENIIINNKDDLKDMLVHFFDDSKSMRRFSDTYKSKVVKKIKARTGKKDEKDFLKYEKQEVENAMIDYENVKTDETLVNNSANVELKATCGFDYSVKSNVSNQICASVVKNEILSHAGISVGIGFDKNGVPLENIVTISDKNIYSNQGIENVPTENEFEDFSSSAFAMMDDVKRKSGRNEVVIFRNTEESTIKASYFLCVCNVDLDKDEESRKEVEEYRTFANNKGLPFVFIDSYEINKEKNRQINQEFDVER